MAIKLSSLLEPSRLLSLYQQGTSLSLLGPPGVGKSSVIRTWPAILSSILHVEFGYVEQLAPSIDAPDVRGFMIPSKDAEGRAVARYTYPAILPTPDYLQKHSHGILFVDEYNQADHLTQKGLSPLILDNTIGEYTLPPTWWVVTASNRMSDRSGVVKPLMHNINRQRIVEIRADVDGWVEWAQEHKVHPMGIAFAKSHPGVVFSDEVPAEPRPFCTARSFTSAMGLLAQMVGDDMNLPTDGVTQELIQGDMGEGAAASFFGYAKVADHLPSIEEIRANPMTAKCPSGERLDAAYAAQQMCVHHADPDSIDPVWTYCERLPKELQVATGAELMKKGGGFLLNSQKFGKWVKENKALIMATTAN